MTGTRTGFDGGIAREVDGGSIGDATGAFRSALNPGNMIQSLGDEPEDLGTLAAGPMAPYLGASDEQALASDAGELAGEETNQPLPGSELSFADHVSTGFYLPTLPGEASGFAAARSAPVQLELDTTGWEKLQYGLANIFVEAQTSLAGLEGEDRELAMQDFHSINQLAPIVGGMIVIDAVARDGNTAALQQQLEALGLKNGSAFGNVVSGYLPIDAIDDIASLNVLGYARPAYTLSNAVIGQQVHAMQVDTLQSAHPTITGTGVTVGVMSDSFDTTAGASKHYADDVASGDLPAGVNILADYSGGPGLSAPTDEGRAMAQAVYDIAPGANLMFHTAQGGMAAFANGILALNAAGADIIVDDISYLFEPVFQDGIIAQAVDLATAAGSMYFSSAGNQASASWQGVNLKDSGITVNWTGDHDVPANNGLFHLLDFDNGPGVDISQTILKSSSSSSTFLLTWDQPWLSAGGAGAQSDIALFLLDSSNRVVATFTYDNFGDDPIEGFSFGAGAGTFRIAIGVRDGDPIPSLVKWYAFGGGMVAQEYATNSGTAFGHSNAATAISVGASFWATTDEFGFNHIAGQNYPYAESFSSKGGIPILFDDAGNRLAQPEFRSTVDLTASDGADTTFFGQALNDGTPSPNFFGTSQAAPNAAAVAALLMQAFPTASNAQIEAAMKLSARDINIQSSGTTITAITGPGLDLTTGTGLIDANKAFNVMAALMANNAPVIGAGSDFSAAVTELVTPVGNLTDSGIISFTDADGAHAHSVTNGFAVGGVLGSLTATILTDTIADGSGGQIQWNYSVAASAVENLAAGQTKVDTFAIVLDDKNGSQQTIYVTATVTGTEDLPIISLAPADPAQAANSVIPVRPADSAARTLTETNAALSASGTLTATDADYSDTLSASVQSVAATGTVVGLTSDNNAQKAWMTVPSAALTGNAGETHNLGWSFNSGSQTFDYLNATESLTLTYAVQVDDHHGGTASQNVVVTVNGTGDAPVISLVTTDGASAAINETNAALTAGGTLTVVDPDLSDSVTPSVVSVNATGTLTGLLSNNAALKAMLTLSPSSLTADAGATHNLHWSFNSGSEAFNYLDEGETLTLTYVVRATDTTALTADQVVTVTVTGTNDGPSLNLVSASDGDSAALAEGNANLSAQGTLTGIDPDWSDSLNTSIVGVVGIPAVSNPSVTAMLSVTPSNVAGNPGPTSPANITWSFTAAPTAFDYLGAGQTQVLTYTVRVTDDSGATADHPVTITVTGTNEAPIVTGSVPIATAVVELPDGAAGEGVAALTGTGTISFADTDLSDTHSASFVADGAGYLGTFSLGAVNQATDKLGWTFSVSDGALNALGAGAVSHQSYTVTVSDGHGGTSSIVIGVDLIGSNDAAVLSPANVVVTQGLVPVTAGGTLTISDDDNPALFQPLADYQGSYGKLNLAANGNWSYVADGPLLNIAAGQVVTDSFTVRAADGTPTTISVAIAGSNDVAIAHMDSFTTGEGTLLGNGLSLFADNGSGADLDPDGPPLAISAVNGDPAFVGHQITLASGALLTVNANGTFSYNPNHVFDSLTQASGAANQSGFDSFTYTLAGGTTATVFVNVDGVNGTGDLLRGNSQNNVITGFDGVGDLFRFEQGGTDTGYGLGGNDGFYFGSTLDGTDHVDGGDGTDTLAIQGNVMAQLGEITNVEVILALSGSDTRFGDTANNRYDYDLTTSDSNVGAGKIVAVQATGLLPGEDLHFDGSAETDGAFRIFAGQGDDALKGGAGNDGFFFGADGNLTGADRVDGGGGTDTLALRGNYVGAGAVIFQNATMTNVEVLAFLSGHANPFGGPIAPGGFDYDVTLADGNVAAGQRLDVNGAGLGADESLRFDGHLETNGTFRILGGSGDDSLIGGAGGDHLHGGMGADRLEGGAGADVYSYSSAAESTSTHFDTIVGFDWHVDRIDAPGGPRAIDRAAGGSLSLATFDSELAIGLNGVLGAGQAALFTATAGALSGHVFAVIDVNGIAGYQAGEDLVIELANAVTPIDPAVPVIL